MSLANTLQSWGLGRTRISLQAEINEELDFHIQSRMDELVDRGMTTAEARRQANHEFGDRRIFARDCEKVRLGQQLWFRRLMLAAMAASVVAISYLSWISYSLNNQNLLLSSQLRTMAATGPFGYQYDKDFKGIVKDEDGNPIANARVLLLHKSWPRGYMQRAYSTTTNEKGRFVFDNQYTSRIRNGFLVTVLAEGHEMTMKYELYDPRARVPSFKFDLPKVPDRSFTFVDDAGEPLANADIFLSNRHVDEDDHLIYSISRESASFKTDESGNVVLSYFQPGDIVDFEVTSGGKTVEVKVTVEDRNSSAEEEAQKVTVEMDGSGSRDAPRPRTPPATENNASHVRWLRDNAIAFDSVDPDETDFQDLQQLKEAIGDARIVQLGEQSHGDGTCFETKTRLVKFLHQEMGFDVLAFESGLYDCHKAWQAFKAGDSNAHAAASQGVFGIWTGSAETAQMWDYLAEQAGTDQPLELAGFDCQFTAAASRKLADELADLSDKLDGAGLSDREWETFSRTLNQLIKFEPPAQDKDDFLASLDKLAAAIAAAPETTISTSDSSFWKQQFASMADHCGRQWDKGSATNNVMARDEQMANNMIWLAKERFPNRKIIVWAASFHIMRNPPEIESFTGSVDYSDMIQMGHRVYEALGDEVYTIGFTAFEGTAGAYFRRHNDIGKAPEGTLESLCEEAGLNHALIPFRGTRDSAPWLHDKLYSRPMGYSWMKASWPNHFDAMVFNRKMNPSTSRR